MTIAPITLDFSTRFGAEEVFNPLGFLQLVLICRVLVWYVFDFMGKNCNFFASIMVA
jgi:hypothetical protein